MLLKTTNRPLLVTVVATTVFGFALRAWHILWGLPFNLSPSEQSIYDASVLLASTGHLEPGQWAGPSALAYLCSVPVYALHWIASVPLELVTGSGASPGMIAADQWSYLAAGRILIALFGAAAVAVVAIGVSRVCRSILTPLLAGLIVAILPLHVEYSHIVTAAVPASFAIAVALVAAFGLLSGRPPIRSALLAFGAVGLAAGFEPAGVLGLVPVFAAILLYRSGHSVKLMLTVLGVGTAGVVFLITTPLAVSQPDLFVSGWASLSPRAGGGFDSVSQLARALQRNLLGVGSVGPLIVTLAVLSFAMPLLSRYRERLSRPTVTLASLALVWLVTVLSGLFELDRATVVMVPALAISAAFTIEGLFRYLRSRTIRLVVGVLVIAALTPSAIESGRVANGFGLERTETQSYDWFVRHVPGAARVARDWTGPQLPTDFYSVLAQPELSAYGLERLLAANADYIVVSLPAWGEAGPGAPELTGAARTLAEPNGFYRALFESAPAAAFCPSPDSVRGPEIWIFPQSQRARSLHNESPFHGDCLGPAPF